MLCFLESFYIKFSATAAPIHMLHSQLRFDAEMYDISFCFAPSAHKADRALLFPLLVSFPTAQINELHY